MRWTRDMNQRCHNIDCCAYFQSEDGTTHRYLGFSGLIQEPGDSVVLYLPIQLCIWVAAYLKQASPDPPADATRTVRAPVVIDSTPLLGELTVLPYNAPDKQSDQVAKGVDSAPKSSSSCQGANEPPVEDHRVLKRFLQVKGPALQPYNL